MSECVRDLICGEQERSAEIEAVRDALIVGEFSGEPQPFDVATFKRKMHAKHGIFAFIPAAASSTMLHTLPASWRKR